MTDWLTRCETAAAELGFALMRGQKEWLEPLALALEAGVAARRELDKIKDAARVMRELGRVDD